MNQIFTKFVGDTTLCSKYVAYGKNKANELARIGNNFTKIYKINDVLNGKACDVLINITLSLPFIYLTISTSTANYKSGNNYLSSGLSIQEINQNINDVNYFSLFYPKNYNEDHSQDGGFINYQNLYRDSELDNYYSFYKTNLSRNINQNHYIFGSQFTGDMSSQVQLLLGSTNIDIKYRFDWYETQGIFIDRKNNKWLITINSNGVFARELTLSTQEDSTVKVKNGSIQKPISVDIIDGVTYNQNDTKLSNISGFYEGFPLSSNQGWAFNSNGSKIRNITYKNNSYIEYSIYEISIEDILNNDIISLQASFNIVETEKFLPHDYVSFLFPKFGGINESDFYPENTSILNYSQVKYGPILPRYFETSKIEFLPFGISKLPLTTYFDENNEVKNYYYSYEKIKKETTIESSTGFTILDDFFQTGYTKIGDLTIKNTNTNDSYDFIFKHGIVINEDTSNLIEDNIGDNIQEYIFSLDNGVSVDDFAYKVVNNQLGVDLRDYMDFYIKSDIEDINNLINLFQSNYNLFNNYFKKTELDIFLQNTSIYSTYYNLKDQMANINYWLNQNDTNNQLYRLNEVQEIKSIEKLYKKETLEIDFPPFLYQINEGVLSVFQTLDSNYLDNIKLVIEDINNNINTQLITNKDYYINLIQSFKNNILFIKNITDISKINKIELNNLINDINVELNTINDIFTQINTIIDSINTKVLSLNDYNDKIDLYNNTIKTYFNNHRVGYTGLDLEYINQVLTYNDSITQIYDKYYSSNKYYNAIFKQTRSIKNRKLTHFAIIFNYSTRNSLSVYTQIDNYDDITYDGSYEKNIYRSNEYALYKNSETYVNNTKTEETDYSVVEEIKNYKRYYFTDVIGNEKIIDLGLNFLEDESSNLKYGVTNYTRYKNLLNVGYTTIPKDFTYYHTDVNKMNVITNNYNVSKTSQIKIFSKEVIELETNITDNVLLFPYTINNNLSKYNYILNKDIYDLTYDYDGIIYFNFIKDANQFKYVVSKDIFGYKDEKTILTNILEYSIINNNFVNFIGKAFD